MEGVVIRAGTKEDTNLVIASWLKHYKHASKFAKDLKNSVYYLWHERLIKRILSRPTTYILVACDAEDPNTVFGYCVEEQVEGLHIIHWVYTKGAFRKMGIAKELMAQIPESSFTHQTRDSEWITKKYPQLTYNPYLV